MMSKYQQRIWAYAGIAWLVLGFLAWLASLAFIAFGVIPKAASAAEIPTSAKHYQRTLTRNAQMVWGLNAPVSGFAAQIHQESGWNPAAKSPVGAEGLAQFMPSTAKWLCGAYRLPGCETTNPTWAIRAMVTYDHHLYTACRGHTECDRAWCALRSYNGGLGNYRAEAKHAADPLDRQSVAKACGTARRSVRHCPENLGYPHRIIDVIQPRYVAAGWGQGWCP